MKPQGSITTSRTIIWEVRLIERLAPTLNHRKPSKRDINRLPIFHDSVHPSGSALLYTTSA
jgi:hypothetical protein